MFWSRKKNTSQETFTRKEPPLKAVNQLEDDTPPVEETAPESTASDGPAPQSGPVDPENLVHYASLLGVEVEPDAETYRQRHADAHPKSDIGIPLPFSQRAESIAFVIASAYEEKYDAIKAQMRNRDLKMSMPAIDDHGQNVLVNFAALAAAPTVAAIAKEEDLAPFCALALHWMLASGDKEWVFTHLVEATAAYRGSAELRSQLHAMYEDDFDTLHMILTEALYQYIHRNVH